ncbi:conjugal transfer ATP-binding protein TraC [Lachnospiraceae bacterium PF1-22]
MPKKNSKKLKKYSTSSTQKFLGIEKISHGIVVVRDNGRKRYIRIMEVEPTNFHLKTNTEKNNIINQFYGWIRISPQRFQISITTMRRDASAIINNVQKYNINKSPERQIIKDDYIRTINEISGEQSIRKQFLVIMEYEGNESGEVSTDFYEIVDTLNTEMYKLQSHFAAQGTEVVIQDNYELFTCDVLYKYLNPKTSKTVNVRKRIHDTQEDAKRIQGTDNPIVSDVSYIAPTSVDPTDPRHILVDGVYHSFLYVKQNGYVNRVTGGWVDCFADYESNVDVSLHFEKMNRDEVLRKLRLKKKLDIGNLRKAEREGKDNVDEIAANIDNVGYIMSMLGGEAKEDLFNTMVLITVKGDSIAELKRLRDKIKSDLKVRGISVSDCYAKNEEAFRMSLPLNYKNATLMNKAKRNFTSSAVASTYPFTAYEIYEPTGEVWGKNLNNDTMLAVDVFDTGSHVNHNMLITGCPGAGKTFAEQVIAGRMCLNDRQVVFILPLKGHEYKKRCDAMGGSYIKVTPGSVDCINLFDIRPSMGVDEKLLGDEVLGTDSLMNAKITQIKTFFSLLLDQDKISDKEDDALDVALAQLYKKFGITINNNSIYNEDGSVKVMPTFSDFDEQIADIPCLQDLKASIQKFIVGQYSNFNGQSNVVISDYTVFDVNFDNIAAKMQAPLMFLAMDAGYSVLKESRLKKTVMIIDEVWKVMRNEMAAEYVLELLKIVRGYSGSCIITTQDVSDLTAKKMGEAMLNAVDTKLLLKANPSNIGTMTQYLGLKPHEAEGLPNFIRGEGLLLMGQTRVKVMVLPSKMDIRQITTDGNILNQMAMEDQKARQVS